MAYKGSALSLASCHARYHTRRNQDPPQTFFFWICLLEEILRLCTNSGRKHILSSPAESLAAHWPFGTVADNRSGYARRDFTGCHLMRGPSLHGAQHPQQQHPQYTCAKAARVRACARQSRARATRCARSPHARYSCARATGKRTGAGAAHCR